MTGKAMTAEEYHRRFADRIIEQTKRGAAPWQKPWEAGRARFALEPRHGLALLQRQRPASGSGGPRPRLRGHPPGGLIGRSRLREARSARPSRHRRVGTAHLPV